MNWTELLNGEYPYLSSEKLLNNMLPEEHKPDSRGGPQKIFNQIFLLLQEASMLMELVHDEYDGITVRQVITGCGETKVTLTKEK